MTEKVEALRLADALEAAVEVGRYSVGGVADCAAAELRRLVAENEALRVDQDRLVWAMHNMSNPFGRHEFGFSQHVLERGSVGDIDDCRTYIDAEIARSRK